MAPRLFTCFGKSGVRDPEGRSLRRSGRRSTATADEAEEDQQQQKKGGIVVELFSSQGCATSPEAELVISRLGRGDFELGFPITVLAFHVDYWDYVGWKDPYGSSQWTVRQKAYVEALKLDTMFTPQVVVQGRAQAVGNDEEALVGAIKSAPRYASPTFQASFQKGSEDTLQVTLTGCLRSKVDEQGVNVMVALYESGMVTDCPRGENKGKVLSNDYVVRRLEKLCFLKDTSAKKNVSGTVNFSLWEGFNPNKCGVALFTQNSSYHIFGSQKFELPSNL